MPDPDPCMDIVIIVDKPCWQQPEASWNALIQPAVMETLRQSHWNHPSEINILLTDREKIQQLNKQYRHLDKPTNVLSFPSLEPSEVAAFYEKKKAPTSLILGDVALAFEIIQQEAALQHKSFEHHLIHLVVHGVLHLLAYDHEKEKDANVMESLEIKILSSLTVPNPYKSDDDQDDDNAKYN